VIFALTSWWFIYFSALPGSFKPIYFSMLKDHPACQYSYLQHFKKLVVDLGMPLLMALIAGLFYLGHLILYKKQYRWSVPIMVAASVYTVTSFFILKEPWFCLAAPPALAMISAGGALWLVRRSKKQGVFLTVLILLVGSIMYKGLAFSYNDYHAKVYPHGWPLSIASRDLATYLNKNMKDDDRLMITVDMAASPSFIFYWKPHLIQVITGQETAGEMISQIIKNKISWFVDADPTDPERRLHSLGLALKGTILGEPDIVGCAHVWKTKRLWPENKEK